MVDRMRHGRVFLAGDAAHIHSPTGGQGITTGMQDAANLAWKLARVSHGAPSTLLDTYDEERLPHAAEVLRETNRTTTLLFAPNPVLRILRNTVVLPILRRPWVQQKMFGKFSQLHVHYRASSLSVDSRRLWPWSRRTLRAGDRAPDVLFKTATGVSTLFELMNSSRPLVLFDGVSNNANLIARLRTLCIDAYVVTEEAAGSSQSSIIDANGDFAALYGLRRNFICLIRPDGHVGLILNATDQSQFQPYLEKICDAALVRE